ncbi:MAG TPA: class II aldolase/adducin family protein [Bordetella sp.]|uniref:class II aldolase/adducin family protein n=1 Tax=Bordetella sp. TaxID=28081 RepID=UPI002ED368D5
MGNPLNVTQEEWQIRCDLAGLYRLAAHFRMTDIIDTHISARIPGCQNQFLINRYGVMFHEMCASDLVKIDQQGNVIETGRPAAELRVNKAGFTIHSAVHSARHDLNFVIHTHTAAGIAVSAQENGLLPISQHALKYYGKLSYHDYEGIALDLGERERLVADLGPDNKAMILRNHGLLAAGRTASEAFQEIYFLERACQAQVAALAGGTPLRHPDETVCRRTADQYAGDADSGYSDVFWQASLRLIENDKPDYRS